MLRGGCSLAQPPTGTLSLAQDLSLLGSPWSSFQYEADLHSRLRRAHQQHTWRETHRQVGSPLWWGLLMWATASGEDRIMWQTDKGSPKTATP